MAALILVLIGESLAAVGMNGGRFLLAAPASELQARRDASLASLRNLVGSTQDAYGPSDWPYGLHACARSLSAWKRAVLDEGISEAELKHVALLAIATLGLPKAVAALTWIEDVTDAP